MSRLLSSSPVAATASRAGRIAGPLGLDGVERPTRSSRMSPSRRPQAQASVGRAELARLLEVPSQHGSHTVPHLAGVSASRGVCQGQQRVGHPSEGGNHHDRSAVPGPFAVHDSDRRGRWRPRLPPTIRRTSSLPRAYAVLQASRCERKKKTAGPFKAGGREVACLSLLSQVTYASTPTGRPARLARFRSEVWTPASASVG